MRYLPSLLLAFVFFVCCDDTEQQHFIVPEKPEWSPNGSSIAIQRYEYDKNLGGCDCGGDDAMLSLTNNALYLSNTNGAILKKLTPDSLDIRQHSWSPAGDNISFTALVRGYSFVVGVVDTHANLTSWRFGENSEPELRWSPDGSELLYINSGERGTDFELVARRLSPPSTRTVLEDTTMAIQSYDWSRGNTIAISFIRSDTGYIALMNPGGANFQIIDTIPGKSARLLRWSSDDSLLTFVVDVSSSSDQVFFLDVSTGEKFQHTNFPSGRSGISEVRFSPNDTFISVAGSLGLYVIEVNGPDAHQITTQYTRCSWSPDSKQIVYISDNSIAVRAIE